jgi:hypothetical protein
LEESLELPEMEKQAVVQAAKISPEVTRQTGEVQIQSISVANSGNRFVTGGDLNVDVRIESTVRVESAIYSVGFYRQDGVLCFSERSSSGEIQSRALQPGPGGFQVRFGSIALRPGIYSVEVIINDPMGVVPLGRGRSAWFKVIDTDPVGTLQIHAPVYKQPCSWEWND